MEYTFGSTPLVEDVVFALHIDTKDGSEHIVIGEKSEVRLRLQNHTSGNVFYDEKRELGQLAMEFHGDTVGEWNQCTMLLQECYPLFQTVRWKKAEQGRQFLMGQCSNGTPAQIFASIRIWELYLKCFNLNHGPAIFKDTAPTITRSFGSFRNEALWRLSLGQLAQKNIFSEDEQTTLWYPSRKRSFECAVATTSLMPILFYYLARLEDAGLVFIQCQTCLKPFLADNKKYKICSEECRKEQNRLAKRKHDRKVSGCPEQKLYDAAYYRWSNRVRKARKKFAANPERLAAIEDAFVAFRAEGNARKKAVTARKQKMPYLTNWLNEQANLIDDLMELE